MRFHKLCIPCLRERVRKTVKFLSGKAEKVGETSSFCEPLLDTLRGGTWVSSCIPGQAASKSIPGHRRAWTGTERN